MKLWPLLLAGAFILAALAFLPEKAFPATICAPVTEATPDAAEDAFMPLLNAYRAQDGLPALSASPRLSQAAAWMANDLATHDYFSHVSSDGRTFVQRAVGCGYQGVSSEIIAGGTLTAQDAFTAWKGSPGHNAAMLGNYGATGAAGIGRAFGGPYRVYWVVDFGVIVDGALPAPESHRYFAAQVAKD